MVVPAGGQVPTPTTNIEARIVPPDGRERPVWVQTAVVDAASFAAAGRGVLPQAGGFGGGPVLVVEAREQLGPSGAPGRLVGCVDVAQILSVEQTGPAAVLASEALDVAFVIVSGPSSNLLRREGPAIVTTSQGPLPYKGPAFLADLAEQHSREAEAIYRSGSDGALLHCFVAGPSAWKRRESVRFFDELRILAHFAASGAPLDGNAMMG